MGKAREQIPAPVVTPPTGDVVAPNPPPPTTASESEGSTIGRVDVPPSPLSDLPTRALTAGGALAREYALAAAEQCPLADGIPGARAGARRLLRLALAHLES